MSTSNELISEPAPAKEIITLRGRLIDSYPFMQREGGLGHANEAWQLQVAQPAFDVLCGRLRSGCRTVKCPWMQELIHVQ